MNKRRVGAVQEQMAAAFLTQHGVRIVDRNFRNGRAGEIDLIGYDGEVLVFIEVKYRNSVRSGTPEEAVTKTKQLSICRTARFYIANRHLSVEDPMRFDVVAIQPAMADDNGQERVAVRWIRNAFPYQA